MDFTRFKNFVSSFFLLNYTIIKIYACKIEHQHKQFIETFKIRKIWKIKLENEGWKKKGNVKKRSPPIWIVKEEVSWLPSSFRGIK